MGIILSPIKIKFIGNDKKVWREIRKNEITEEKNQI